MATRKVVILDQFVGPSPYWFSQNPTAFEDFAADVQAHPEKYQTGYGHTPEVREVAEDFRPEFTTTAFAADENGLAHAWRMNWDSSG